MLLPTEKPELLLLIENDKMLQFIKSINNVMDITIDVNDNLGFPLVEHNYYTGFCKYICSTEKGLRRCIESKASVGFHSANKGQVAMAPCHAGALVMALPIIVQDLFLGSITCCQIHLEVPNEKTLGKMLKATSDLGFTREMLVDSFLQIKVISHEKCAAISNLIQFVVNYITELIFRAKEQEGRLKQKIVHILESKTKTELENSLRLAELKNLQSQIQPHFLFNTLNTLSGLIFLDKKTEALEVVYSLSEILRYNLTRSGELVTLKEELRNVENYLQLMKIRFGERLNYRIEIDDRLMEVELPYFTLQPLVENAIMHGLEPKQGNGYVLISGRTLDDGIELVVEDNGLGMPAEIVKNFPNCLDAIVKKDSLGLINVHSRLQLCFGADFGLRIVQEKGKTQVKVLLPGEKTSGSLLQLSHY